MGWSRLGLAGVGWAGLGWPGLCGVLWSCEGLVRGAPIPISVWWRSSSRSGRAAEQNTADSRQWSGKMEGQECPRSPPILRDPPGMAWIPPDTPRSPRIPPAPPSWIPPYPGSRPVTQDSRPKTQNLRPKTQNGTTRTKWVKMFVRGPVEPLYTSSHASPLRCRRIKMCSCFP